MNIAGPTLRLACASVFGQQNIPWCASIFCFPHTRSVSLGMEREGSQSVLRENLARTWPGHMAEVCSAWRRLIRVRSFLTKGNGGTAPICDLCDQEEELREQLELCDGMVRLDTRKRFFPPEGGQALSRLPREWSWPQSCQILRRV